MGLPLLLRRAHPAPTKPLGAGGAFQRLSDFAVLLPERFRGGCAFGAGPREGSLGPGLSRESRPRNWGTPQRESSALRSLPTVTSARASRCRAGSAPAPAGRALR